MKILFLGTGTSTGVPQIACQCKVCQSNEAKDKRLRSSVLVSVGEVNILIDCGPDFRQQALKYNVSKIDGILLTHEHYDHVSGLDELRPLREADVYAEKRVLDILKSDMPYIFCARPYPGAPDIRLREIKENETLLIKNIEIQPIRATHYHLPVLGFRINNFAYLTDFSEIPDEEYPKLTDLEVLVIDALRTFPHHAHLTLEQALEQVDKINPKRAYFIHMSHDMGLHDEVQKSLPENVFLSYDGLELNLV